MMLVGLAAFVFLRGILPALSEIDSDFPGYFTAARIVIDRQDTARLYDDAWFQEQMRRLGLANPEGAGKFAPFPPPTALLLVPLARCEPLTALRIVTAVSVLCLICSMFLLARMLSWRLIDSALFVLSSGLGILSGLRNGQPYIVVSTFCILGYYLYLRGRPWLAGICLGVFVPIKYYPVAILAGLALRREWRVLLGAAAVVLGIGLASITILGWPVHRTFLLSVLGNHLTGRLSLQDLTTPYTPVYQSFDTLLNRLFVFDPARNPRPLLAAPRIASLGVFVVKGVLLLVTIATLRKLGRAGTGNVTAASIGLIGILVLLIAPATATYTFVLLWLPVALLVGYFLTQGAHTAAYFALTLYVLIGFIPYAHTYPFDGRGLLTVLAYPRLWLVFALFVGCVCFLLRPGPARGTAVPGA